MNAVSRYNRFSGTARAPVVLAAMVGLMVQAPAAWSQETSADERAASLQQDDDVIIVTARRTAENLQSVPVTVTALSAADLQARGIDNAYDLQFAAPSVTVSTGLSRLSGGYTVRGLSAGVVTYFNDIPGGPVSTSAPYFDMNSVQVLNGPQGTLFGRTAAAGAVLLTPQAPDLDDFGGFADITLGNYDRLQSSGAVNLPIIPGELALRVAYQHREIDGYTRQIGSSRRYDAINDDAIRASLRWERGGFKTTFIGNFIDTSNSGPGWVLEAANPNLGTLNVPRLLPDSFFGAACNSAVAAGLETSAANCVANRLIAMQDIKALLIAEADRVQNGGKDAVREALAPFNFADQQRYRHYSAMNVSEIDFGDLGPTTLTVKNLFSYQRASTVAAYGLDGLGGRLLTVVGGTVPGATAHVNQVGNMVQARRGKPSSLITEEFQIKGRAGDILDWNFGLYYQKSKTFQDMTGIGGMVSTFSGLFTANRGYTGSYNFDAGSHSREIAGFGQLSLDFDKLGIPGLNITGGYRKTDAKTVSRTIRALPNPAGTGPVVPDTSATAFSTVRSDSSGSNYSLAITQKVTPDFLIYASTAKSFVPGGVNAVVGCDLAPNCSPTYNPETVKNYELGIKTQTSLGSARVTFNADVYRMDYKNIQQGFQFTSGATSVAYTQNVAAARMQGAEAHLNIAWREGLGLTINYSYLDAKYRDWVALDPNQIALPGDVCLEGTSTATGCLIDLSNNPFPRAPKHQLNGTLRWQLPVPSHLGSPSVAVTGYMQSRQYLPPLPSFRTLAVAQAQGIAGVTRNTVSQAPYGKINLRLQWDNILESNLSAGVFVDNLTNTTYSQGGGSNLFTLGTAFKLYSEPRMWGFNLRYDFGG